MNVLQVIIAGIFSLSVGLGSVWLKYYLDNRKKLKEEEHHENLSNQDIDTMVEIQKYIDEFRRERNFDRLCIFQFHNGGKFFQGVPMKKYSQTFESLGCGISGVKMLNQGSLVTEHPLLMQMLNEKDFFSIDGDDPRLDYIRNKIVDNGIIQIITAPIRTLSGQLIGFVQIHSVKHKIEITEKLKEDVLDLVLNISGYLVQKKK